MAATKATTVVTTAPPSRFRTANRASLAIGLTVVAMVAGVVAWMWLEQLLAADGKDGDFYDGKRAAAEYFFTWELPKTGPQLDLLASLSRTTLDMKDAWF